MGNGQQAKVVNHGGRLLPIAYCLVEKRAIGKSKGI